MMRVLVMCLPLLWAAAAGAQSITSWSAHGPWTVETYRYDDGRRFCLAGAQNGLGNLALADDGVARMLVVRHLDWDLLPSTALEVTVDDGASRVLINVPADRDTAFAELNEAAAMHAGLVGELARGAGVKVRVQRYSHDWPLDGFAAALAEMPACVAALVSGQAADPADAAAVVARASARLGTPRTFRDWVVDVQLNQDQPVCLATVGDGDRAMTLYGTAREGLFVRFLDKAWELEARKVDVKIRVDRRADWTVKSVKRGANLFDIAVPENEAAATFIENLKGGNWVYLHASSGLELGIWSLAGSRDALEAWGDCIGLLRGAG